MGGSTAHGPLVREHHREVQPHVEARPAGGIPCPAWSRHLIQLSQQLFFIVQEMEDSYRKASSSSKPSETLYDLAEVCSAYYKAKQKDGSSGKSRKSKECRVLSSSKGLRLSSSLDVAQVQVTTPSPCSSWRMAFATSSRRTVALVLSQ